MWCHTTEAAQEQPKERGEDLEVSPWPQNASDTNLIKVHGACLKNKDKWSAIGTRGLLTETMFGWVSWVQQHPHEY